MKWCRTIFLLAVFLLGTQVLPVIHASECAEACHSTAGGDPRHDADDCPICQVFHAPMDTPVSLVVVPVPVITVIAHVFAVSTAVHSPPVRGLHRARAPPAAA